MIIQYCQLTITDTAIIYYTFVLGISWSFSLKKSLKKSQVLDYLVHILLLLQVSSNFPLVELCSSTHLPGDLNATFKSKPKFEKKV